MSKIQKTAALFLAAMSVYSGQAFLVRTASAAEPAVGANSPAAEKAVEVTAEDAAKKYPAPKGGYPAGEKDLDAAGIVVSPYSPNQRYDCKKIPRGALVLDSRTNKVFVRP